MSIRHYYVACRGYWVESVGAKHAGAGLGDAIIKIYSEEDDLT